MTGEKDIWGEKPPLLRNAGTIEVGVNPKFLDWLENLKAKITQLNECLGEYESKEWCDHCIIDSKCAQITLHVQELKKKAEKWDLLFNDPGAPFLDIMNRLENLHKIEREWLEASIMMGRKVGEHQTIAESEIAYTKKHKKKLEAVKNWYLAHELLLVTPKNFDECARARYKHFDKLKEILEAEE